MIGIIIAFIVFIWLPLLIIIWGGINIIKTIQLEKELNNKMEILTQIKRGGEKCLN